MAKFKLNSKQPEARKLLNTFDHSLVYGGSRSGKTFIIIRNIILRAMRAQSRHLIVRFRFNHAKTSLWYDTIPKVMRLCFPGVRFGFNKSDWFITVPVDPRFGGGESQIWIGGLDDKERTEKVLGHEYSTIFINEASQVSYDSVIMLRSRLAENVGLVNKEYIDCNPSGKNHWTYQEFIEKLIPGTKEESVLHSGHLIMNPFDNIENLNPRYIKLLESFPKRQRQRFLEGLYLTDVEGALWTDAMISQATTNISLDLIQTVIGVDPAVTNQPNSDETGIVACGLDENRHGVVLGDYSLKASTRKWAQTVVNAYYKHEANYVVVEVNNGGDLVKDALKNIDESIKVVTVHASKGKFARAEPVSELYELGKVSHIERFPILEAQLTEYVPLNEKKSPDRLDALVWALTKLMLKKGTKIQLGAA